MADDGSYPSLHTMSGSADNTEKSLLRPGTPSYYLASLGILYRISLTAICNFVSSCLGLHHTKFTFIT